MTPPDGPTADAFDAALARATDIDWDAGSVEMVNAAVSAEGTAATLRLLEAAEVSSALVRSAREATIESRLSRLLDGEPSTSYATPRSASVLSAGRVAAIALLAACVSAVAFFVASPFSRGPAVGHWVAIAEGAQWTTKAAEIGDIVRVGEFVRIDSGFATVRLGTGVTADLIAPVRVRFDRGGDIRLFRGSISAEVGESGHGFAVRTDDTDVVDLGTKFVIHKDAANGTSVSVQKGRVEARLKDNDGQIVRVIELLADQQLRFDVVDATLDESAFGLTDLLDRFRIVRRARGGVTRFSGAVSPLSEVSDGLDLQEGALRTDGRVVVIPERTGIELAEPLAIETAAGPVTLPAGTVVDSYLAHFDMAKGAVFAGGGKGAISFETQVLAVIDTATGLAATDRPFGVPAALFSDVGHRGLETDQDTFSVTADGNSVTFDMAATPAASLDQFRVLVRAAPR
ncbi:MAG: FecR domain-containing protein [Planctomycetota bacterium]